MKRLLSLFLLCAVSIAVPMQSQFAEWAKNIQFQQGLAALSADAHKLPSLISHYLPKTKQIQDAYNTLLTKKVRVVPAAINLIGLGLLLNFTKKVCFGEDSSQEKSSVGYCHDAIIFSQMFLQSLAGTVLFFGSIKALEFE